MSSYHLLHVHPRDLLPFLGCHSVQRLVHLLSFILAICPAHLHFRFSVYSIMSNIFVLFVIQIPRKSHTPQRHYKRKNPCQDQSSVELFWKKKNPQNSNDNNNKTNKNNQGNIPGQTTPHITQKTSKLNLNGPMCLANNDLWLPNMVSQ